jgi:hypothetical protein
MSTPQFPKSKYSGIHDHPYAQPNDTMADDTEPLQKQIELLQRLGRRPPETQVVVTPLPALFEELESKVIERMELFGPMLCYFSSSQPYFRFFCQSAEIAAQAISARQIVVDGQVFRIWRVKYEQ